MMKLDKRYELFDSVTSDIKKCYKVINQRKKSVNEKFKVQKNKPPKKNESEKSRDASLNKYSSSYSNQKLKRIQSKD